MRISVRFQAGPNGLDAAAAGRPPLHPAMRSLRAPLRERAGRLARDTMASGRGRAMIAPGRGRRALCGAAPASRPRAPIRPAPPVG